MEAFIERLFAFLEYLGLSQNKFEEACGLTHTNLRERKQGPTVAYLMKISSTYPQLSMDWLVSGRGNMIVGENYNNGSSTSPLDIHHNGTVNINYMMLKETIVDAILEAKHKNYM